MRFGAKSPVEQSNYSAYVYSIRKKILEPPPYHDKIQKELECRVSLEQRLCTSVERSPFDHLASTYTSGLKDTRIVHAESFMQLC